MTTLLHTTHGLIVRYVRTNLRIPIFVLLDLVQPMIWLLLFGQLFSSAVRIPGFGSKSYVEFLAPGIVVQTAFFGAVWSGMTVVADLREGIVDRYLTTPASRLGMILARVAIVAIRITIQAAIVLIVAVVAGARPHAGVGGYVELFVAAALLAAGFGSLASGLALLARREETLIGVNQLIGLPLSFLCSIFIARNLMPPWMRTLAEANPIQWAVEAGRGALEGTASDAAILARLGLLAAFAVLATFVAVWCLERYRLST